MLAWGMEGDELELLCGSLFLHQTGVSTLLINVVVFLLTVV